jgi:glycosyltransferase involved in cell wall biosynthesis
LLRNVPDVVSNSFEGRDFLVGKLGVPSDRVRVINNAVIIPPPADGTGWRTRLGLAAGDRLVIMVANLTRYKDHETLMRAFAIAKGQSTDSRRLLLMLAGRPEETALRLKALAFDLGLGDFVHFAGAVSEIDSLYAAANLVVHSSVTEGCPNAVLEAMAHGKCVVGTDISGLRQALGDDARESFLAPPGNAERLAELIVRWLDADQERDAAGRRNRDRIVAEFSPDRLLDAVLNGIAKKTADRVA